MKNNPLNEAVELKKPHVNLFYRIMRITTFLLFFCTFCSFAGTAHSQSSKVTIKKSNVSLLEVLNEIENQTNYLFIYSNDVDVTRPVSLNADRKSVASVLSALFKKDDVHYVLEGTHIVLTKRKIADDSRSIQQTAQAEPVKGVVLDRNGDPVIGASVAVKGGTVGTITDLDGKFSLDAPRNSILIVSFIGYKTQEVSAVSGRQLNITLEEDTKTLDEVVVVGYGTQKKANLTGAVTSVGGKVLENRPITNIGQGLQGVVPNLNVTMNGGAPGKGASFNVRGTTSLNGGSPLVLVDNVQMDPNLVNPDDVESISVLKDAASAAIYGARAAYGVILITTKNGKKNAKPQINLSINGYWQTPAVRVTNVNSIEFMTMKDIAFKNGGGSGSMFSDLFRKYVTDYYEGRYPYTEFYDEKTDKNKWQYCGNTDWFKELYRTSFSQMYNVSLTGGTDKTIYYASIGMNNVNGVLKAGDDHYDKYNVNLNLSTDVTPWLNVSGKISHTHTVEKHPSGGNSKMNPTAWSGLSAYSGMMKNDLSPFMPVKHSHTGRLYNEAGAPAMNQDDIHTSGGKVYKDDGIHYYAGQGSYTNPVAIQEQGGKAEYKQNDLWMTGAVRLTPLKGLVINADYTFNFYGKGTKEHVQPFYDYTAVAGTEQYYPWTATSSVVLGNNEDYYQALNAFAEYTKSFNDTHNFKIMAGYNQEKKRKKHFWAGRQNLIDVNNPALNLASGDKNLNGSETHWAINGFFARINYNYKQRYLVEMNGRYDGSSRFKKGERYAFFPSFSAAWRISEEKFFTSAKKWIDDFKLRASWGSLGNQAIEDKYGNFPYLPAYGVNQSYNYLFNNQKPVAVTPSGLVSASFTWETVNQLDFGFDLSMFDNRLNATFDWYRRNTKDMLTAGKTLPAVLGTRVPVSNAADLKTCGWEISLNWRDRLSNGIFYWVKGVLSDYQSEITRFANEVGLIDNYYVGRKIGEIWGYRVEGLFQSDQEVKDHVDQSRLYGGKWASGDVKYKNLNNDDKIDWGKNTLDDHGDLDIIGNDTPRFSYGITAGMEWKGIDFEMFWQGVGKRDYMPGGGAFWGFSSQWDTPLKTALDYWTPDNKGAYFPRPSWVQSGNRKTSDRYLQNASYVRLKNITLGYTLPKIFTQKAGIGRLRIYLQGENLLTFTPMIKAFDPEEINNLTYPIQKKVSVGLNLTL